MDLRLSAFLLNVLVVESFEKLANVEFIVSAFEGSRLLSVLTMFDKGINFSRLFVMVGVGVVGVAGVALSGVVILRDFLGVFNWITVV